MAKKILIVDDEHDVVKLLKYNLEKQGFDVRSTNDGSLVLAELRRDQPDLIILDLMLPGVDGLEICRQLRRNEKYASLPILMLTARTEEADRVVGLEIRADDYVTKPFSMRELTARIRALLRRRDVLAAQQATLQRGNLTIDPSAHSVTIAGRRIELSALEFKLLHYLGSHPGMVFSRDRLLDRR
jgi:two-component system, OmpR family, alkaline phosphatase synthesis response regulator PhoP